MHSAKIIADSLAPNGTRLTTMEVVFPRIILAEFNTHRMFSRNSASSRAIPVEKMLQMVKENPYIPTHWGKNQKGMQAWEEITFEERHHARNAWLGARDQAVACTEELLQIGIHKQITNRLLEPFMWHTVVVTATEWSNFFHLRNHSAAHPDIQKVAKLMQDLYESEKPTPVPVGGWHLPYITKEDIESNGFTGDWTELIQASIMRCARVSFLRQNEGKNTLTDAEACQKQLLGPGHMSPFEHVATPRDCHQNDKIWSGNFKNWIQYRKMIPGENDMLKPKENV